MLLQGVWIQCRMKHTAFDSVKHSKYYDMAAIFELNLCQEEVTL